MHLKLLGFAVFLLAFNSQIIASPDDMVVTTWDYGCNHTMNTNHFDIAPGESVEIDLDLQGCYIVEPKGLLFFGYYTTKNSSKPLVERNNVRLTLVDGNGNETVSDSGAIYTEVSAPEQCKLYAENLNHRKTVTIRLRSSLLD